MARIIKKGTDLEQDLRSAKKKLKTRGLLAAGLGALALLSFLVAPTFMALPVILGIAAAVTFFGAMQLPREIEILRAGIQGENLTNYHIGQLPDTYTAFRNLTVSYQNKKSEIDTVIVGPTGVFIVETKNLNGTICGSYEDHDWVQHKVGRGGTPYQKSFYSPVKQVNTQVYRLANYLKERGHRAHVYPIVYFANIEASLQVTGRDEKTALFAFENDGADAMLRYVLQQPQKLSPEICQRIVRTLQDA